MISTDLRIQLEGRLEVLEAQLPELEAALGAARRRDFTAAAALLSGDLAVRDAHGDAGLLDLLARCGSVRAELCRCVRERLELMGMPAVDLAAGARWLSTEPVLYEHHRVSLAFALRGVLLGCMLLAWTTAGGHLLGSWPLGMLVGAVVLLATFNSTGWSDALLTSRRLMLDGQVVKLAGLRRVVLVRPWFQVLPLKWEVELHYHGLDQPLCARLRHPSVQLRHALQRLRIDTGSDWGPW